MFKPRARMKVLWWLVPLALLTSAKVSAESLIFTYTFGDGSVLSGEVNGTVLSDGDTVAINSFGVVTWDGVPFPIITTNEINTLPYVAGAQPLFSFSGLLLEVRVCASGFTAPDFQTGTPFQDCNIANEGGFLFTRNLINYPHSFVTVGRDGLRSRDRPINVPSWQLVRSDTPINPDPPENPGPPAEPQEPGPPSGVGTGRGRPN